MDAPPRNSRVESKSEARDFTDLVVWQAAVSMTANIAEGYGRFSYQENLQFCRQSRGSVYEIRDHLTTALDAAYITPEQYKQFDLQVISVIKLINGYLRATKQRQLQSATRK
jgi:four helix bundle protein